MKNRLLLILAALSLIGISACGGKKQTPASTGGGPALKIAIVTTSGVDDGSFGQDCYNGVLAYIKTNPNAKVTSIKEPDMSKSLDAAAQVVADYDVLILPGFQFGSIGPVAMNNPETKFIIIDAFPIDKDGKEVVMPNVCGMMFKQEESGFFAGVASALETRAGKVAMVNGMPFPSNIAYQFGFVAGVNYTNKHYGTKAAVIELPSYAGTTGNSVKVGGNYIGGFADQSTGKVVGNALINAGVDVMAVAAGDSGHGVFAAAKEAKNVHVVGCDVDRYDEGANGNTNILLTSAVFIVHSNVTRQLEAIGNGAFTGKNELLGAAAGSTGYISTPGRHQLQADTLTKMAEVEQRLVNGEIVPPGDVSGNPANFPGL
ncbi:BMP family ABC transporter substrate-binding protein [Spirochaetia bacterium]|nr:BMP family ABC transporter substrate-binding protein [Spirochaetia bacterium]